MEMVAASKMRRAQDATKETSAYAHAANELTTYLAGQQTDNHPYFNQRQVKNRLLIVIASDKRSGWCV